MSRTESTSCVASFPDFEPLDAGHRAVVTRAAAEAQPRASEMTFAYLFAWRDCLQPRVSRYGESLLALVHSSRDETSYLLPPLGGGERKRVLRAALDEAAEKNVTRSAARLPEELASEFHDKDGYKHYVERPRADYVYRQADLQDLPLPDYRDKRNRANRFWNSYSGVNYCSLDANRAEECIQFCREWRRNHPKGDSPGLAREVDAVCIMLENFDWLGIRGGALEKDGRIIAFSLGEKLNDRTFVVRAEKADTSYRGAYQAINQEFVRDAADGFRLVNRESDMGVPGIRRAKKSYKPCHMVRKWRTELK